jgi:hypothetical protein
MPVSCVSLVTLTGGSKMPTRSCQHRIWHRYDALIEAAR